MKTLILSFLFIFSGAASAETLNDQDRGQWNKELDLRISILARLKSCINKAKDQAGLTTCGVQKLEELKELNKPDNLFNKTIKEFGQ